MSNMEKLEEMIRNDAPFMEQLKGLSENPEGAAKLIDEYAIKHGFDPEEVDDAQLEAGGFFWTAALITVGVGLACKLLGGNKTYQ